MFRIGEFASITQVSVRMLRYYEEQGILLPAYTDPQTGYRMYQANQIEQLQKVLLLKSMGFQIREMKELLQDWKPEQLQLHISDQIERTKEQLKQQQLQLVHMQGYLDDLTSIGTRQNIQILFKSLPDIKVLSYRKKVADYYCEGDLWKELGKLLCDIPLTNSEHTFTLYHDLDDREENVDIEICIELNHEYDKLKLICNKMNERLYNQGEENNPCLSCRIVEGVETAASFLVYGPYSNISGAYREFAYWLEQHPEYQMYGPNRQICHVSAFDHVEPENYVTELLIPLNISYK